MLPAREVARRADREARRQQPIERARLAAALKRAPASSPQIEAEPTAVLLEVLGERGALYFAPSATTTSACALPRACAALSSSAMTSGSTSASGMTTVSAPPAMPAMSGGTALGAHDLEQETPVGATTP